MSLIHSDVKHDLLKKVLTIRRTSTTDLQFSNSIIVDDTDIYSSITGSNSIIVDDTDIYSSITGNKITITFK